MCRHVPTQIATLPSATIGFDVNSKHAYWLQDEIEAELAAHGRSSNGKRFNLDDV